MTDRKIVAVVAAALLVSFLGCRSERAQAPAEFEPNLVHVTKYRIKDGVPVDQALADVTWVVAKMFGTPDEPMLPDVVAEDEELSSIVSLERLIRASGPAAKPEGGVGGTADSGRGLFRQHCVVCHGITGNGRGPTAAVQFPYPRDYRMGVFKFKSTPRGVKPTRKDLARLIRGGIDGTAMKKIPELTDADIEALVDYVIYLSWRGELERTLVDSAMFELDLESGARILNTEMAERVAADPEFAKQLDTVLEEIDGEDLTAYEDYLDFSQRLSAEPGLQDRLEAAADDESAEEDESLATELDSFENYQDLVEELAEDKEFEQLLKAALEVTDGAALNAYETYLEAWELAEETAVKIAESWLEAEDEVLEVPEPPADLPLARSYDDVLKFRSGRQADAFAASVKRGQELFVGKIASCSKCHGPQGLGNGQTTDYDDWTKDWTSRVGLKPEDRETLIPLLARGALPPRNAIPRNFAEGVFRGGSEPEQLYRRITQGIDGTPMPAATFVEGEFEQDDVWHIVNFIRSLEQPEDLL